MCGLAHFFESQGFATVLVGFVREHIEMIKPARALWLNFPMGRPLGKPNDPEYQKWVIRSAFKLFEKSSDLWVMLNHKLKNSGSSRIDLTYNLTNKYITYICFTVKHIEPTP